MQGFVAPSMTWNSGTWSLIDCFKRLQVNDYPVIYEVIQYPTKQYVSLDDVAKAAYGTDELKQLTSLIHQYRHTKVLASLGESYKCVDKEARKERTRRIKKHLDMSEKLSKGSVIDAKTQEKLPCLLSVTLADGYLRSSKPFARFARIQFEAKNGEDADTRARQKCRAFCNDMTGLLAACSPNVYHEMWSKVRELFALPPSDLGKLYTPPPPVNILDSSLVRYKKQKTA